MNNTTVAHGTVSHNYIPYVLYISLRSGFAKALPIVGGQALVASLLAGLFGSDNANVYGSLAAALNVWAQPWPDQEKMTVITSLFYLIISPYIYAVFTKAWTWQVARQSHAARLPANTDCSMRESSCGFLEPLLFPSRTTHRRLFPTTHSFGYSYLLVGVPVTDRTETYGTLLSSHDTATTSGLSAWFSVHASEYLRRGAVYKDLSLRAKLNDYVTSQGVDSALYPHAYLVTAPRFLGFSFNPVSFWYLYDASHELKAMILEVNNTFDERRMYLLHHADAELKPTESGQGLAEDKLNRYGAVAASPKRFTFTWQKDFHVSPFNDREGSYSVSAIDVAATKSIDVTITLRDDDEKPKLVARIWSTPLGITSQQLGVSDVEKCALGAVPQRFLARSVAPGVSPTTISQSRLRTLRFIFQHFYIGFLTNPRIIKEARTLWAKKLTVFYRPEPRVATIGRNESAEEVVVEEVFRGWLEDKAKEAGVIVRYMAAAGSARAEWVELGTVDGSQHTTIPKMEIQVLTPQFYSELAKVNVSVVEVFERFCFLASQGEGLVHIPVSDQASLQRILACSEADKQGAPEVLPGHIFTERGLVRLLRGISQLGFVQAIRLACGFYGGRGNLSELDRWAIANAREEQARSASSEEYFHRALIILLADRLAFGSPTLLKLQLRVLRMVLVFSLSAVIWRVLARISGKR